MDRILSPSFILLFTIGLFYSAVLEARKAVSFYNDIKPIFQTNCNGCHQPAKMKGDYLMTEFSSLLQGGETGAVAVVPGYPEKSYLIDQIITDDDGFSEMPKGKNARPLHGVEISLIKQWIKEGALDDSPAGENNLYTMSQKPIYQKVL